MFNAGGWAHWMWYRENLASVALQWNSTTCIGYGARDPNWMTSAPSTNRYHIDAMNDYPVAGANGFIGYTAHWSSCFPGQPQTFDRLAMTMRIADTGFVGWAAGPQNTLQRCLSTGTTVEEVWAHEVGHGYGLDHNNGWQTLMNSSAAGQHHCNVGSGFHQQPFSDETQFMWNVYPRSGIGTPQNVSGTPMALNGGSYQSPTGTFTYCASASQSVTTRYTFMNHYAALTQWLQHRAVLTTASLTSPPTPSDILWGSTPQTLLPAGGGSSPTWQGATVNSQPTWSIPGSVIPVGGARVWIQLDPNGYISETDEGDNLIPTNIVLYQQVPLC